MDKSFAEAYNKLAVLNFSQNNHRKCVQFAGTTIILMLLCTMRLTLSLLFVVFCAIEKVFHENPNHFGALGGSAVSQRELGESLAAIKSCRLALIAHPWAAKIPTVLNYMLRDERVRSK